MEISVYFKGIKKQILESLDNSKLTVKISVAWFTNEDLFNKLLELLDNKVKISLIILDDFINNGVYGLDFDKFLEKGGHLYYSTIENPVHNKFCIIDKQVVLTGSYNWTYYAEYKNYENELEIRNQEIIEEYNQEFEKLVNSLKEIKNPNKFTEFDINSIDYFGVKQYLEKDLSFRNLILNNSELNETESNKNTDTPIIKNAESVVFSSTDQPIPIVEKSHFESTTLEKDNPTKITKSVEIKSTRSLGIAARMNDIDDKFSILIKKDTKLPITQSSLYYTCADNQTSMTIDSYKGENEMASSNLLVGKILISDLPKLPAGKASVKVTFTLDVTGSLNVSVLSVHTGNKLEAQYYGTL